MHLCCGHEIHGSTRVSPNRPNRPSRSPRKEPPEEKPIIGVKRSFSAFQKAQYQEKWPRNYEVMIQSPKPAKPVLHLPQLEASRFIQLQTRHWRPGDHFNQSGDIIHGQEELYKSIPCTSSHWIRRILIYSNLPYLEQTDINVQQLFPLQFRHDLNAWPSLPLFGLHISLSCFTLILSTFQAVKKVPRKLTYPLKPSRFKKDQILYLEPKSHKRLQRLEAMVGKTHGQSQMAKQNQQLTALQEINDWIAQLRKRNKARAQRPQQGERRFGDAPEAPEPVIVQVKAKVSPILDKSVNESSTTCMSHLSLSKNVKTGPEVQKETNSTSLLRSKSMLFKEAKPILKVSHQGRINDSYKLIEVPKKEPDHKLSHEFTPKSETWPPKL
ncbi:hypothetical protein IGI04_005420 [Brassica rapa subsp. trilocularis]|uniref:Uncharacterized protein n=1 Tax=Brassica rapa subsp. trilocularis TaxID=1813537 RepID=A0ABQ7NG14_BRACM|nr:hypothetical protein IGI04_005420 [Brassica rapa subsp. trilocularis]